MRMRIVGLKRFRGVVDGKSIDSAKVFCEVRLDDSRNGADQFAKGKGVEEIKCASDVVKRIEHLPLPFDAEVETERVSNGKVARENVIDVRPLDLVKPAKVAA